MTNYNSGELWTAATDKTNKCIHINKNKGGASLTCGLELDRVNRSIKPGERRNIPIFNFSYPVGDQIQLSEGYSSSLKDTSEVEEKAFNHFVKWWMVQIMLFEKKYKIDMSKTKAEYDKIINSLK